MVRKAEAGQVKNNGPLNSYVPYVISWRPHKHGTSMEKATAYPKVQSLLVGVVFLETKLHESNFMQHCYIHVNQCNLSYYIRTVLTHSL